jgi:ADP-ribose pyrophosphatase YjhB (NUDIX family)
MTATNSGTHHAEGELSARTYPAVPRVGVGVAVLDGQHLLLVKRGHEPKQGSWSLPGGMVELGEPVREAARREVREECGIEVELSKLLDVVDFIRRDDRGRIIYHYVLVDFLGKPKTKELQAGDDVEEARWFRFDELASLDIPAVTREFIRRHVLDSGQPEAATVRGRR